MHAGAQPERPKRQSDSGSETVPVSISELFVLFNDNLACPNGVGGTFTQSFLGEVTLDATFTISINMIASGTLVPTASVTFLSFSARMYRILHSSPPLFLCSHSSLQSYNCKHPSNRSLPCRFASTHISKQLRDPTHHRYAHLQGSVTALGQQLVNVVFPGFLIDG